MLTLPDPLPATVACKDLSAYKRRLKDLKTLLFASRTKTRKQDELMGELKTSIIVLTEENIHLRAKLSKFRDSTELSLGLDQARDLISNYPVKSPSPSKAAPSVLFEDIEELKTKLAQKRQEYNEELKSPRAAEEQLSTQEEPLKQRPRRARKRTKQRNGYVPSHLRVSK